MLVRRLTEKTVYIYSNITFAHLVRRKRLIKVNVAYSDLNGSGIREFVVQITLP